MKASIVIVVGVLALASGRAEAYPQFQMSFDQTCSGCHISPAGGGLLTENGMNTAETISAWGTNPEFLNGAFDMPAWLALGGDVRAMWGYLQAPQRYLLGFPMQADLYAAVKQKKITGVVTVGLRPAQDGNEALTRVWSREHYVMWQSEEGAAEGIFLRAGHFMPVFGLRLVEHPAYTRRYGGTPLYSETYGVSASLVKARLELHASGFVKNPIIDPVRQGSGGALYGELRVDEKTSIGAGGMIEVSDFDHKYRGTLTAKRYLEGKNLLLQGELQFVNPHVGDYGYKQLVGNLMLTYFGPKGIVVDVAFNHFDGNLRIADLDRDAFDLNVHFFATSHIELMLVSRLELMALGSGGPTGAYAFLQAHYRL